MLVARALTREPNISEALALRWSDVDFRSEVINLKCAVVHQKIGEMKTEVSQKPVPMAGELHAALQEWRAQTVYRQDGDWAFASPKCTASNRTARKRC